MDQSKGVQYKSLSKRTVHCVKYFKLIERIESLQAHFNIFHDGEGAYEKGQSKLTFSNLKSRKRTQDGKPLEVELAHLSEDIDDTSGSDITQRPSSVPLLNLMTEDSYFPSHRLQPESKTPDNYQFTNFSSPIPGPSVQPFGPVTPSALVYGQQSSTGKGRYFFFNNN